MEPTEDPDAQPLPSRGERIRPSRRRSAARRPSSLEGRKKFAVATLALSAVLAVACAWAVLQVRQFLTTIPAEGYDTEDEETVARADAVDQRSDSLTRIAFGARILCAVAFLLWFYRAHENARTSGRRPLDRSSGWAVGSFFVPLLGLVMPCLAMLDVWGRAHSYGAPGERERRPTSVLVLVWWFAFIGASIMTVVANAKSASDSRWAQVDPNPVATALSASSWMLASRVAEFVAAVAAIVLVVRISALQARTPENVAAVFE